jgi:hypothetical protein
MKHSELFNHPKHSYFCFAPEQNLHAADELRLRQLEPITVLSVCIECGNEEVERGHMIADSIFLIYFDERIQKMKTVTHIQPYTTGGRPPVNCCVLHSQLLLKSKIGACLGESGAFDEIPCSVFNPLQHSLIGVPCSVFNPLQHSLIGVPCSVFNPLQRSLIGVPCSVFSSRTHHSDPEPNWYIYHSDHLGSSSFLTDAPAIQPSTSNTLPFGENYIEQRATTDYYTPYTFSAKERDTETGYSYFGARYYDPMMMKAAGKKGLFPSKIG